MATPNEPSESDVAGTAARNAQKRAAAGAGSAAGAGIHIVRAEGPIYDQASGLLKLANHLSAESAKRSVIFAAERDGRVLAALNVEARSAIQASCLEPKVFGTVPDAALVELLSAAKGFAAERSSRLITALVDTGSSRARSVFEMAGFEHAGDVNCCLCHSHHFPSHIDSPLVLRSAGSRKRELTDVMQRTCVDTLDLPKLLSVWSPSDMLAHLESLPGHRPELWLIAMYQKENVGTLLLECEDHECRLTYFGLLPEYRGRGWGHVLLSQAMQLASSQRVNWMVLSVDCKNLPARRIYEKAGFLTYITQSVFYCPLGDARS